MLFDEALAYREAQSRPALGTSTGRIHAVEPISKVGKMLWGDTFASVGDTNNYLRVLLDEVHADRSIFRHVPAGI